MSDRPTFKQREGIEAPLPAQLSKETLPPALRAALYDVFFLDLNQNQYRGFLTDRWNPVLRDVHIRYFGESPSAYSNSMHDWQAQIESVILNHGYAEVYAFVEFILRHKDCPREIAGKFNRELERGRAAFRIMDGDTFVAVGSDEERVTIETALENLAETSLEGAKRHLKAAASQMTAGDFASSIRESIHAVESIAQSLEPSADLQKALTKLEAKNAIHAALKKAFLALYGYSSDEKGIRHSLAFEAEANVDESDAQFMLGACAAFVSYVLGKARTLELKLK